MTSPDVRPSLGTLFFGAAVVGTIGALVSLKLGLKGLPVLGLNRNQWQPAEALNLGTVDIRPSWESAWVRTQISDNPETQAIVANYVSGLTAAGYTAEQQGVWVAAGEFPMGQHQGDVIRPAASLTKVATTLAALATWGPEYQFETFVGYRGRLENGILQGDLVIEGSRDPLFVWEEAIALGNTLQKLGIDQVTGDLILAGDFTMNFDTDIGKSGQWLKQALNANEWNGEIQVAYDNLPSNTPQPTVAINGQVKTTSASMKSQVNGWLVRHDSLPLVGILKAMNIYSNNPIAEQIANTVGGPTAVVNQVEKVTAVMPGELSLINGSGLGEENQMSPRAVVLMLQEIQNILQTNGYTISDIFPIVGADGGTVKGRNLPRNAVVKTGSLAVVSSLAGAVPTQDRGLVWFSLINYGAGLESLRSRQDKIVAAIEQQWGKASDIPPELRTTVVIGQDPYRFGDSRRNVPVTEQYP